MFCHWPFHFRPKLDWLQVEISSHCNAACRYCPRTLYKDRWLSQRMDVDLFRGLLPILKKTDLVYLQGWGEPFTHPGFFQFVRIAKAAGCRVGTTTNGMLLGEDQCERLVGEQVDVVGFSLAGTGPENDQVRQGTRLSKVLSVIETLHRIKQRTGVERPAVHIAYLLLRSGLPDLQRLVDLLKKRGISQVVISTLDFVGCASWAQETIRSSTRQEAQAIRQQLEDVATAGHDNGLLVYFRLPVPRKECKASKDLPEPEALPVPAVPRLCSENIQHAAFIGVNGTVSPCVYANLPVSGVCHVADSVERPYCPIVFGHIQDQSFAAIWRSLEYAAFRKAHRSDLPPSPCRHCAKTVLSDCS